MAPDGRPPTERTAPVGGRTAAAVTAGVVAAMLAVGMTTTAVAITGRGIADDLGVGAGAIGWVVNTYLLVAAAFAVAGGRVGDVVGRGRAFVVGSLVFAGGSVLAAAAPGLSLLLAGRAVQGLGAALVLPASIEVVVTALGGAREHEALRARGVAFAAAFGSGPLVGGLLTDHASWRLVFVVVAVLAVVAAAGVAPVARHVEVVPGARTGDVAGALLLAVAVGYLVLAGERSRVWGRSAPATLGLVAVGVAALVALVAVERHAARPLLHGRLLRDRVLVGADLATFASSLGMLGLLYFFGLYARSAAVFDSTTVQVGLVLLPFTVSLVVLAHLSSWLSARFGRSVPVVVGMVMMGLGFLLLARTTTAASEGDLLAAVTLCGVGAGVANAAVVGPGVLRAPDVRLDEAAGLASLARFAGTAFAVAIGTVSYLGVGHHPVAGPTRPASAVSGVGAEELAVGGKVFDQALAGLDRDLREPFRAAVRADAVDGFTTTMAASGVFVLLAAGASAWLLRPDAQPSQSSSGVRSRRPAKGSSTQPPSRPAEA